MVRPSYFLQFSVPSRFKFLVAVGLTVFLSSCGGGGGGGGGGNGAPPFLDLSVSPDSTTTYPSSTFSVQVKASTNTAATPTLTSVTLPSGITTSATFPVSIPSGGVSITFQTSATIAAGTYTITLNGQAASVTSSANVSAAVQTNPPAFYFVVPLSVEMAVPTGGSAQIQFMTQADGQAAYSVQLSVSGLPPGTNASITPQTITPGQTTTVMISASSSAPVSQNTTVTLTGTPAAPVSPATIQFLVDVTPPQASMVDNRTDYVSTNDTPYAAVFDPAHQLVYASNSTWNRVDVISTAKHAVVTRIPMREPRGIDLTQDGKTVWVASGSRQMYAIDTSSLAVTRYLLPQGSVSYWEGGQLLALADGTLMMVWTGGLNTGIFGIAIWNPGTNGLTALTLPTYDPVEAFWVSRSGDGTHVYFFSGDSDGSCFYYDVATQSFSQVATPDEYIIGPAVNQDASRLVICGAAYGPNMYDGNFNLIGPLPACPFSALSAFIQGGSIFSADNLYLYQVTLGDVPAILKIDANTLNVLSVAPALPMIPVMVQMSPSFYVTDPIAVDSTGMVYGIQDAGIAFDDAAYTLNYSPLEAGSPIYMQHMDPYFGPLTGGTASSGFGNFFSITPGVWYGGTRGTASLDTSGAVTITSPPASTPGPVNIKMLFPDGTEVFDPLFFSYGTYLQYALQSGASPEGGVPAQLVGYGLPGDDSLAGTLTIGGATAAIGSAGASGLPLAGTAFPSKVLTYTVPPGSAGWADITLTTADGTSTLPKSFFYAKSVTDYSSSDTLTAVLYDNQRQQLYLSAGNHIDVFSLTSNQFVTSLNPPANGTVKLFGGLALTPDGSMLLATDLADGSLAAISPDNPSNGYAIPIVTPSGSSTCPYGPLYVAATSNDEAMVVTGSPPAIGCGPGGSLYLANLSTKTLIAPPASGFCPVSFPAFVAADANGDEVAIGGYISYGGGFCIYNPVTQTSVSNASGRTFDAAISGDGQIAASQFVLTDGSANVIGRVGMPNLYYSNVGYGVGMQPILLRPQLNASGSLFYWASTNFVEIVDVGHAFLRIRFALSETVNNTVAPMAIDSGGRYIFLLTNKGLTIVDLGEAPLSIGWVSPTTAAPGTQVNVRGSGFNSSTTATVNGLAAAVSFTDENTLSLTIPGASAGLAVIVLTNSDGTTYTAAYLLTIQ